MMEVTLSSCQCQIVSAKSDSTLSWLIGRLWVLAIFFMAIVPPSVTEMCHQRALTVCFEQYNSHIQHHLKNQEQHFYNGIDVESLRTICHTMQLAVQCTQRKCPGLSHDNLLQVLPSDVTNVIDLCSHPQIYEVYARNQFCFSRIGTPLKRCYNTYVDATNMLDNIKTEHSPDVQPMCSELSQLVNCIELRVTESCNTEAASLVELLVRPSIQYSQFCPKRSATTTTTPTTPMPPTRSHYRYREEPSDPIQQDFENEQSDTGAQSSSVKPQTMLLSVLLFALVTVFLIPMRLA